MEFGALTRNVSTENSEEPIFLGLRLVIVGLLGILCGMPLGEYNALMESKRWWHKAVFVLIGGIMLALAVTFPACIIVLWVRFKQ